VFFGGGNKRQKKTPESVSRERRVIFKSIFQPEWRGSRIGNSGKEGLKEKRTGQKKATTRVKTSLRVRITHGPIFNVL